MPLSEVLMFLFVFLLVYLSTLKWALGEQGPMTLSVSLSAISLVPGIGHSTKGLKKKDTLH